MMLVSSVLYSGPVLHVADYSVLNGDDAKFVPLDLVVQYTVDVVRNHPREHASCQMQSIVLLADDPGRLSPGAKCELREI